MGLSMDDAIWDATVFSKIRHRLKATGTAKREACRCYAWRDACEESDHRWRRQGVQRQGIRQTGTTPHTGYPIGQRKRKRVEEIFGWLKTAGLLGKTRHRGVDFVGWMFTFGVAIYNLIKVRNLMEVPA